MLIFEHSRPGCHAYAQAPEVDDTSDLDIPKGLLREDKPLLPEVSELQTVRHYTTLSRLNFSIDTHCYPLGSCSMKYNPRGVHRLASLSGFLSRHPLAHDSASQGILHCLYSLQEDLKTITGMQGACLTPMAGAQGEYAGIAMIKAYHQSRGEGHRNECLIPDAAHGTNPASAVKAGYVVKEIPTHPSGDIDLEALKAAVGPNTAAIMLTNPSTLGVFERDILEVAKTVHEAGGLLYYDGANLNAILGQVRPGDMGFDVIHINTHKTFATPHGGGGPGAGPIVAGERLLPYLPVPRVSKTSEGYRWLTEEDCPQTIGRMNGFMGNVGVLLRAYIYIRMLGEKGLKRVSQYATLNANYLMHQLQESGFTLAYPERRATHEFIVTLAKEARELDVTALDFAKRLLDYGFHAPTIYFPLLVPECFLIEPTETESKESLDEMLHVFDAILEEAQQTPDILKHAPSSLPVSRLDEVQAAKNMQLRYIPEQETA